MNRLLHGKITWVWVWEYKFVKLLFVTNDVANLYIKMGLNFKEKVLATYLLRINISENLKGMLIMEKPKEVGI